MSRKRYTLDALKLLSDDELTVLYTSMREGKGRLDVLEELAQRGVAWAVGLAAVEREQYTADRLARRSTVDLPGVRSGLLDSIEAIEQVEATSQAPEDQIILQMITPAAGLGKRPDIPPISRN